MGPLFDEVQLKPVLCVASYFYGHLHFEPPSLVEIVLAVLVVLPILFTTVIVVAPGLSNAIIIPKIANFLGLPLRWHPWIPMISRIDQTHDYLMVITVDNLTKLKLIPNIFQKILGHHRLVSNWHFR